MAVLATGKHPPEVLAQLCDTSTSVAECASCCSSHATDSCQAYSIGDEPVRHLPAADRTNPYPKQMTMRLPIRVSADFAEHAPVP
jgi:hypothetical protein